jgi:hypothetical protein
MKDVKCACCASANPEVFGCYGCKIERDIARYRTDRILTSTLVCAAIGGRRNGRQEYAQVLADYAELSRKIHAFEDAVWKQRIKDELEASPELGMKLSSGRLVVRVLRIIERVMITIENDIEALTLAADPSSAERMGLQEVNTTKDGAVALLSAATDALIHGVHLQPHAGLTMSMVI